MSWTPDGSRLRLLREQQEYTIEHLADAAGVGEKTIRNLEAGRTRKARLTTLKALAAVLDVDVSEFAAPAGPQAGLLANGEVLDAAAEENGSAAAAPEAGRDAAPSRDKQREGRQGGNPWGPSRLELLVEQELAQKRPAPLPTAGGPVLMLTPKKFQDIITAFVLHQGSRLWLPGTVLRQRGISEVEAHRLATECGVGARFLISQRSELTGGEPFHVTVYSAAPAHTRLLQERLESRGEVALLVRVVVARPDPASIQESEAGQQGRQRFLGFALYGSHTLHPWTLLVEDVLERPQLHLPGGVA